MKRNRIPSFRGLRALIEHTAGADRAVLQSQLERLGLCVTAADMVEGDLGAGIDIYFFDADRIDVHPEEDGLWMSRAMPTVALIGSEAPSRLEALLARQPSAYLTKPIRRTGVYSCLAIAMHQFAELRASDRRLQAAEERVRLRRKVVSAVLQLMQQGELTEAAAYRVLQRAAMVRRVGIEALSLEIVAMRRPVSDLLAEAKYDRRQGLG